MFSFVCQTNRLWVETYPLGLHLCYLVLQTNVVLPRGDPLFRRSFILDLEELVKLVVA